MKNETIIDRILASLGELIKRALIFWNSGTFKKDDITTAEDITKE